MNIHLQRWLISTSYLNRHTATQLQYVVFTKADLLAVKLQTEKHFLVLTGTSGKDIKVEHPWFNPSTH
jgi:hypothetical protein